MIFLAYCIVVLFVCLVSLPSIRDTFSYCCGTIYPICAESAVKHQANKTNILRSFLELFTFGQIVGTQRSA